MTITTFLKGTAMCLGGVRGDVGRRSLELDSVEVR